MLPRRVHPYVELQRLVQWYGSEMPTPKILLLGDSVAERVSKSDTDKRNLGRFIEKEFEGKYKLACLSHSAYHTKIYYSLLEVLKITPQKPDLVIFPINMRSFSPQWDFEPSWQFEQEISLIGDYVLSLSKTIPILDKPVITSELYEVFDATEVCYPLTNFNRIGQFRLLINGKPQTQEQFFYRKEQIFIFHYLHSLSSQHPKLHSLLETIRLMQELKINLLIYITPINYQAGERYVGNEFVKLLKKNTQVIQDAIFPFLGNTINFSDFSISLSSDKFFNIDEATEHLNQRGRAELAALISHTVFEKSSLG
ncbi:MAG: SGNH/GDSL hydrolase family protein [Anaerolineales bacterium]|nr:SGNH/GDSL hydrolase family protein [Anaerolineales bacterium]